MFGLKAGGTLEGVGGDEVEVGLAMGVDQVKGPLELHGVVVVGRADEVGDDRLSRYCLGVAVGAFLCRATGFGGRCVGVVGVSADLAGVVEPPDGFDGEAELLGQIDEAQHRLRLRKQEVEVLLGESRVGLCSGGHSKWFASAVVG